MKQCLLGVCSLFLMIGCTTERFEKLSKNTSNEEFYAVFEGADSRTYVDGQIRMRWTAKDKITMFRKSTYNREYMFTGKTGANAGGFRQTSVDDEFWYGEEVAANYAVYPHSIDTELDETDLFLTVEMPSEQTYVANSFGLGANTMVAVSEGSQLMFKNVGSYLRVRLYGDETSVSSITLTSKGDESISGTAKITPTLDGFPTCEMTGSGKSIRLTCPTAVAISTESDSPTDFWIVVPPVTLSKGFSVTVEDSEGSTQVYDVDQSFTFKRNSYYDLKREVTINKGVPYLTFTADAAQTFSMSKAVETLEYSVNGGDWKVLGTTVVPFGGELGVFQLRGKSLEGTAKKPSGNPRQECAHVLFGNATYVACSGDIRTLVDYENYDTVDTSNASFCALFFECWNLISAPKLSSTKLGENSYFAMFYGCTSLVTAPELPATELTNECYAAMFVGCTSLTVAPELPATALSYSCYNSMFVGCTSLVNAPELPAITLADECYSYMFKDCTNLKYAPRISASILARNCCYAMFYNCTSLITAPQLSATTLANSCYEDMFLGCTSLTTIPGLPATTLTDECYRRMFYGCTSLTTAPQLPAATLANRCYESMFMHCTSLVNAPELSATTLADRCYAGMFFDCEKLTIAPELLVTTLTPGCYGQMFSDCISLVTAPQLPAEVLASSCYSRMFSGCTSLTTAPELPALNLASHCYQGMFSDCTSLITAPKLPATTVTDYCYNEMFSGCSNLTTAPVLSAISLKYMCYDGMFENCTKLANVTMLATYIPSASYALSGWLSGVSSTGTFIKASAMESLPFGSDGIPNGWTVKNYGEN